MCYGLKSEISLNYQVIVKRYPFFNGVVGGSIPTVKFAIYLTKNKNKKIKINKNQLNG